MLQRTTKILIGKDISRDAQVVAGADMYTLVQEMAAGELVVLDKNKTVLTVGATIADSDIIYIAQGSSVTYDFTNHAGTAVSGARKLILSDAIQGSKVKSYKGVSYSAKAEQSQIWDMTTTLTCTAGTEYILRLVYKDIPEHPGQFVQSYRVTASSTNIDTTLTALAAEVNKDKNRRVNVTYTTGTDAFQITAREIADCCTALTDIDDFRLVEFDAYFNYVDSDGNWQTWADPDTYLKAGTGSMSITDADYGSGNWEQLRDLEKSVMGYRGVYNKTHFPVINPAFSTVVDDTYHMIVIEHDRSYVSPDNQYVKDAPLTTIIACDVPSSGTQLTSLLSQLNPWMASCPGAFDGISF